MPTLTGLLAMQSERLRVLSSMAGAAQNKDYSQISRGALVTQLGILEQYWEAYLSAHSALLDLPSDDRLDEYFTSQRMSQALASYTTAKAELLNRQEEMADAARREALEVTQSCGSGTGRRGLPKLSLPTFAGKLSDWLPFRDLFEAMIIDNSDLSSVERMHYLRTSLTGEAARIISHMPLSGDSFDSAWALITGRYDNPRFLIASHLDAIFSQAPVAARSARELNRLLDSTSEALSALRLLGAPVDHWDMILVHLLAGKLDAHTREAWEIQLGSSTESPSFESLQTFLTARARALESISHRPQPVSSQAAQASGSSFRRPLVSRALTATTASAYVCSKCSGNHFVASCAAFRALTIEQRRQLVESQRLCYNCLGKHLASSCRSEKRCQECGCRHHTLIHQSERLQSVVSTPIPTALGCLATAVAGSEECPRADEPAAGGSEAD